MKNIIKKWYLVILVFIIIIFIAIVTRKNIGVGSAGISETEFEEIELGMSQYEVNDIVDNLDEWDDDEIYTKCCEKISESYNDSIYTYQYKYYGENEGYVIITYESDYTDTTFGVTPEVIKKEKFDLK